MVEAKQRGRAGRTLAIAATAALAALALGACAKKQAAVAPPAVVLAEPVHATSAEDGEARRYPVEVAARYSNPMSFRVPGKIVERTVRLGDTVRKGQVVARLDPVDALKQEATAQAALEAAEHRLLFATQQLDRDTAQSAKNLISTTQLEQTQDAFVSAKAAREQAADQLAIAHDNVRYQTLVADHDGVITSENADTGQVVAAAQAVFGLAWAGDVDAILDAAANDIGAIAVGQSATVTLSALPRERLAAKVREISASADPQSRSYRVKLSLLHPVTAVRLGMTGEAVVLARSQAGAELDPITVSSGSIFHRGKDPAVWVVRPQDSTLELRPVTIARYGDRDVVITAGLKDGEVVLSAGAHTVYEGERVSITKPLFAGDGEATGTTNDQLATNGGAIK
ncbi:MAG: efflux RND transporter periplasmic adaptor subunit [Burkholderiaceae bacterium]|nr:efflux RND transporter periplasmic adaptor subunit [Burkholderiaceae bacterium]